MKNLAKIITSLFLAAILTAGSVSAQDIEANRLNRDINIMENILSEMFRVQGSTSGSRALVGSFSSHSNRVRGTYLPDYGIIFKISRSFPNIVMVSSDDSKTYNVNFRYADSNEGQEITAESIKDRMLDFLRDYASTIGQLSGDDRVMVIYGDTQRKRSGANWFRFQVREKSNDEEKQEIPVISGSVTMSDLKAYRSGNLNDRQFAERVSFSESDRDTDSKDLRIMTDIFETAFDDRGENQFEIRGSVDYLKLDNFGVIFSFTARNSDRGFITPLPPLNPSQIKSVEVSKNKGERSSITIRENDDPDARAKLEEKRAQQKGEIIKAYKQFQKEVKEYVVDYGRTLKSISSDQFILLSATISSRVSELPERVDFQIKKSILDALDRGNINRDEAIAQVITREY